MPDHLPPVLQVLISQLLEKDPNNRPSLVEILQMDIVYDKIEPMARGMWVSRDDQDKIRQQLIDLKIFRQPV